jgi:electron transfer flavoprotein beta subunit
MNPYDEFAVEEALKLKGLRAGTVVTAISVGPKARVTEVLRTALAMGADEAVVVDAPENVDSNSAAKALAKAIEQLGALTMVYTGKSAIDYGNGTTAQILAEYLNLPHAVGVSKADYTDANVTVEREIEGGAKEIIQVTGPLVFGANKGLNTPRYASLPGIMKAKKKQIKELSLEALGVSAQDQKTKGGGFQLPADRPSVKMLEGDSKSQATGLVKLLREEAKVI